MNKKAEYGGWVIFLIVIIILMAIGWAITGNFTKDPDFDNDGLSDKEELKMGTNISNQNTDGDRYLDGDDKEPLKKNTAKINIYLLDKDWDWGASITNIISLALKIDSLNSETVIADAKVKVLIKNEGDDYTEFVNYDVVFEASNASLTSVRDSLGKLEVGEEKTRTYEEQILLKDVPDLLFNSIINGDMSWSIRVDNLNYKKFI